MPGDLLSVILFDHDPLHIAVAAAVCLIGSLLSVRMLHAFGHAGPAQRPYRAGLLSIIAGGTIWTTHFVAMLGFRPDLLTGHDEALVALSLFAAIGAVLIAVTATVVLPAGPTVEIGGMLLGLGSAVMHYIGMSGFAVACATGVDPARIAASVVLGCGFGALTFNRALRGSRRRPVQAMLALTAAVVLLHFTGMASLALDPAVPVPLPTGYFTGTGLTMPVALVMGLVLIVGLSTLQIDRISGQESISRLQRAAREDPLTGLPNRTGFNERLGAMLGSDGRMRPLLLIAIDLDELKEVNDTHGHAAGDEVLRQAACRIAAWLPPGGIAGRIGGDEFYAALPGRLSPRAAAAAGERLVEALARPIPFDGTVLRSGCSIGMMLYPAQAATTAELFAGADLALHDSKRRGRNRASLYDAEMARNHRDRRQLGDDLQRAFEAGGLSLHYQPQQDLRSGEITGFEALLRWQHPVHGPISPQIFIPLAEERGLIGALGAWVLRTAAAEASGWTRPCRVAVNVAAAQFEGDELASLVRQALADSGLPAQRLELEITETTVIGDLPSVQRQAAELKAIGVSLAMDDYGTGYSALSTLMALPFDKIKFDKSFVLEMETDRRMVGVLRTTIDLGRHLGIAVLAEGVETERQAAMLQELGCHLVQGFLVGRPAPPPEIRRRYDLQRDAAPGRARDAAKEPGPPLRLLGQA